MIAADVFPSWCPFRVAVICSTLLLTAKTGGLHSLANTVAWSWFVAGSMYLSEDVQRRVLSVLVGELHVTSPESTCRAWGRFTGEGGFLQYGSMYGFSDWSHIVSAEGRIYFYNTRSGQSAVCVFDEIYEPGDGLFRNLVAIRLRQVQAQRISRGWTNIVDTGDGIIFYNVYTGVYCVGDFDGASVLVTRVAPTSPSGRPLWRYTNLGLNWTHVERVKDTVLFYNPYDGSGMTATMFEPDPSGLVAETGEPLVIRQQVFVGSGWTHLVGTIDPTLLN